MQLTAKTARAASFTALTTLIKKPQKRQLLTTSAARDALTVKTESRSAGKLIFRVMKLTAIVLLAFALHLSAAGLGQGINLSVRNTPLEKVFKEIKKQSGYQFLYNNQMLDKASKVTISISGAALEEALALILRNQPYDYIVVNKTIILKQKESAPQAEIPLPPIVVKGRVTDEKGEPLIGVSIKVKGTNNGVSTGVNGQYELTLTEEKATLIFSYVGFTQQEIALGGQSTLNIKLLEENKELNQVVVIGYGTAKKSDLTGAVTRVNSETYQNQSMTQLTDMLTGTIAGFNANQNPEASGGSTLQVRGPKSLNASTEPMIVLDGVIFNGSVADINPSDIQTIDILKDASSTAVFGARSAAGVLMITTKKGASGKPVINFSTDIGITESANNSFKPYNAKGYLDYRRDALISYETGNPDYYFYDPNNLPSGITLQQWRDAGTNTQADNTQEWLGRLRFFTTESDNYLAGKSVDWYNKVLQKGLRQNYDVSISGGQDKLTYYWSLGYSNNEGVVRGDKFSTVRSRLNVDFKVTDWLNVGINSQMASRDESAVKADLESMFVQSPYGSEYDADGKLNWYPNEFRAVENPLINYYGQSRSRKINSIFASMYARIKLPFGIDYKLSFQPRFEFMKDYNFWPSTTVEGGSTHSKGYGTREEGNQYEWIVDNLLHWNKKFGVHQFDLTLLYSSESKKSFESLMTNQTFLPNENLGYNGLQFGTNPSLSNNDAQITGDAVMSRLNYSLFNKYLFTASVRRDGYSAFGKKHPRATFPAAAFAWKISDEKFFHIDWVSTMKLRLSYGINGNREIGPYSALAQVSSNLYYDGTSVQMGVLNTSLANYDLVWEKTKSANVGIDLGLFRNRIEFSAEYYDMTTTDLLMNRQLPALTGFTEITTNLGALGNRGFEMTLNTVNIDHPGFSWRTNFVASLNRNKIKRLFGDYEQVVVNGKTVSREVADYTNGWFPGQSIDRIWDYDIAGIWQLGEETAAAEYQEKPGDFKARDVDGNGKYEALQDKMFIGYEQPRYRLGLRNEFTFLKNFTAALFIRADLGHSGAFEDAMHNFSETYDKRNTLSLPYWTAENPNNEYPKLHNNRSSFGGGLMIYKPKSFVRVQDLSLAYNLPVNIARRIRLSNARVYGSVRNLATFTKWPGWDPETTTLPMPRTYSVGFAFAL